MDGFKVTCLKCGNEAIINDENGFYGDITISSDYDGDKSIWCEKCDNEVDE